MLVPRETIKILDRLIEQLPFTITREDLFKKAVSLPAEAFCDTDELSEMEFLPVDAETVALLERLRETVGIAGWLASFEAVRMLENLITAGAVVTDEGETTLLVLDELEEDETGELLARYREL